MTKQKIYDHTNMKQVEDRIKEILDLFKRMGITDTKETLYKQKLLFESRLQIAKQNYENFRYTDIQDLMFQGVEYCNIELSAINSLLNQKE
mgnify:CR=1 FL=1